MDAKSNETKMIRTDWRQEVVWVCGPRLETDTRESWFMRGARRAGVGWRQLKALFHREVTDPKFSVGERVRSAAVEARKEALAHALQLEKLVRGMECVDPDFYGPDAAALVHAINQLRGMDRSRDNENE